MRVAIIHPEKAAHGRMIGERNRFKAILTQCGQPDASIISLTPQKLKPYIYRKGTDCTDVRAVDRFDHVDLFVCFGNPRTCLLYTSDAADE